MIKDKKFYRSVAALALPLALNNVLAFAVQMLDSVMVGTLGDVAVSAVSLSGQPYFIFTVLVYGLGSGGAMLIAQYWGKKDLSAIRQVLGMMFATMFVVAVLYASACIIFPSAIMSIYSKDAAVIAMSIPYLRVVAISYVLNALVNCYVSALQAKGDVKITTAIYTMSFGVNCFFNYALIFGHFGFPQLGIVGAAIGTIAARLFEFVAIIIYGARFEADIKFGIRDLKIKSWEMFKHYLKVSMPVIGDDLSWSLAASARMAIIGHVSTEFVTGASVAAVSEQFGLIMMYGIAKSASFVIGKEVGAGKIEYAREVGRTFIVLAIGVGVFGCLVVMGIRYPLLLLYPNITEVSRQLAWQLMTTVGFVMLLTGIENISLIGVLRGAGDNHFALAVDAGSMWLFCLPLGLIAAFIWHWPAWAIYTCMRLDSVVKALVCVPRIYRGNYIKDVTMKVEQK